MNRDTKRDGLSFFIGLAAGAAAGWWLNSNQGRRWRKDTAERIEETGHQLQERASEQLENVKTGFNTALESGREYATEMGSTVKEKFTRGSKQVDHRLEQVEDAFEEGVRRARQRLREEAEKIENN